VTLKETPEGRRLADVLRKVRNVATPADEERLKEDAERLARVVPSSGPMSQDELRAAYASLGPALTEDELDALLVEHKRKLRGLECSHATKLQIMRNTPTLEFEPIAGVFFCKLCGAVLGGRRVQVHNCDSKNERLLWIRQGGTEAYVPKWRYCAACEAVFQGSGP
jgi:hypothetical protein